MDGIVATALGLQADRVAAEVVAALRAAGVDAVLLKGASIATWLYDDGRARPYGDTDLVVPAPAFDAAEGVLRSLGFGLVRPGLSPLEDASHARVWSRESDIVDLHRLLWGVEVEPERAWAVLTAAVDSLELGGGSVPVLAVPARALHLALHAAQHGATEVKPLVDLARAAVRLPFGVWREAAELARAVRAEDAMAAGLRLRPETAVLADRLGLPPRVRFPVALRAMGAHPSALGLLHVVEARGWRAKAAMAARRLVPTPARVRARYPSATRGRVWLLTAYARRTLALARSVPAVARAARRALRSTRP